MTTKLELLRIFMRGATVALLVWLILRARRARHRAEEARLAATESEARFHAFMDNAPTVCYIKDEEGRLVYLSARFTEIFQRPAADCLGKDAFEMWPREMAAEICRHDLKILSENRCSEVIESVPGPDGGLTKWLNVKFPFSERGKRFIGAVAMDITHREKAEEALRVSEERFRAAFSHATIGMALTDMTNRYLQVNDAFCRITGYSCEELLATNSIAITHPEDRAAMVASHAAALENSNGDSRFEKRYLRKDGMPVWVRDSVGVIRNPAGEPIHFIKMVEDITREKAAEETARLSEERWQLALEGTNDGIWDWDARNNTVYYSARWKEMLGYEEWELQNLPETWEQLVHPEDLTRAKAAVQQHLEKKSPSYHMEYRIRCKDGTWKWVLARGKAIRDADGNALRMIGAHSDMTERKQAEERLLHQANHDSLTGLLSRGFFLAQMEEELSASRSGSCPVTLCLCDIDRFKAINDLYGHQAGDNVLVKLGRIIRGAIRSSDLAGRMGGDEFYVLFSGATPAQAATFMERVRNQFEAIAFGADLTGLFSGYRQLWHRGF